MVAPRVFLDFTLDGAPLGRVIFELFHISAPKTAENFRALCTGERGVSPRSDNPLYYKHSKIHRVIPDFMIQGGDFTKGNGTGGESIYGAPFADEDLSRPVDEAGLLCMANKGPNTNNSQFFITLRASPHLTGKHVVFGRVIRGFEDVIKRIAAVETDEKDRPVGVVEVVNCGELQLVRRVSRPEVEKSRVGGEEREGGRGRKRRRSTSRSRSPSVSRSRTRERSYSRSRSRSPASESDSEAERKRRKKRSREDKKEKKEKKSKKSKKRKHHRSHSPSASGSRSRSINLPNGGTENKGAREETEEEYDARLEREERERIEAARLRELAEIKRRYEEEALKKMEKEKEKSGGVRYKGRGRMKFVDPEMRSRRYD
ncbi:uncharacterized protein FOMMEDRAFT_144507 [Fomitiporia mediterranea MF3/22]|uniref:uncharacterized protein n=1 Tax=Fomitiporia mediterranea (strain MF3/22) TaxID=694068 RepID=UPI0004407A2B|nr:uncharacterized protein FOMMEDRAFT_144507 [Fomitiporia mediterranea MF3/22]EJD06478.1 hypothetical protein FOMMEDRAFT_144507 [Fomitiporia mediterranea MF3/22]